MRITATLLDNDKNLIFEPFGYSERLLVGEKYTLEVKKYRSSRSKKQNDKMWAIIHAIAKQTDNDENQIYIGGLQHAKAKYIWLAGLPEVKESLLQEYRAVETQGTFITEDGIKLVRYKCYIGSSKFDKKEMVILIDYFISLAYAEGVRIEEN